MVIIHSCGKMLNTKIYILQPQIWQEEWIYNKFKTIFFIFPCVSFRRSVVIILRCCWAMMEGCLCAGQTLSTRCVPITRWVFLNACRLHRLPCVYPQQTCRACTQLYTRYNSVHLSICGRNSTEAHYFILFFVANRQFYNAVYHWFRYIFCVVYNMSPTSQFHYN